MLVEQRRPYLMAESVSRSRCESCHRYLHSRTRLSFDRIHAREPLAVDRSRLRHYLLTIYPTAADTEFTLDEQEKLL